MLRFGFGKNWLNYAELVNEERISQSIKSLSNFLLEDNLAGKVFLDIGSGSGLSSLAAYRLGATVHSFDYDQDSVTCTKMLQQKHAADTQSWVAEKGDALDKSYMEKLPKADIVYSWGVLHHTGQMWQALENVASLVKSEGKLFISIYNDQGKMSRIWTVVKKFYNRSGPITKKIILSISFLWIWKFRFLEDFIVHFNPLKTWDNYGKERGMSPWYDVIDWVGGYPFEVAKPEEVFDFFKKHGFQLEKMKTCAGGLGCNEFLFTRNKISL